MLLFLKIFVKVNLKKICNLCIIDLQYISHAGHALVNY